MEYTNFRGDFVNIALDDQGMGQAHSASRHLTQGLQGNLSDGYTSGNNVYALAQSQAGFAQAHLGTTIHALQPQSIDGYVLQSNSSHTQGMTPPGFNGGGSFTNVSPFIGGVIGSLNDPYQRSTFGYGM
jgi:hypothetical protein